MAICKNIIPKVLLLMASLGGCNNTALRQAGYMYNFLVCPISTQPRADYQWVLDEPPGTPHIIWTAKTLDSNSYQCVFFVPTKIAQIREKL